MFTKNSGIPESNFFFLFQILDLSCCKGLNFESVLYIVTECSELIELNLQNTRLCQNSTDILRWVNLRWYFCSLTSNYLLSFSPSGKLTNHINENYYKVKRSFMSLITSSIILYSSSFSHRLFKMEEMV